MRAANKHNPPEADDHGRRKDAAARARRLARNQADSMPVVAAHDGPRSERQVQAPLVDPAPSGGMIGVFRQGYLLRLIVRRQIASKYANSLLGLAWSYIQPGMRFAVYYVVMGMILGMDRGMPYFAIHLFCGLVFVGFFSDAWSSGTRSIWSNRGLILKLRMPREVFPMAAILVAGYHMLPQMLLLVGFCLVFGWHISLGGVVAFLMGMVILLSFASSLGLMFSAFNVFYRDFQNIVGTILQFTHFLVPMMYPFARIYGAADSHPVIYQLYMANPMAEVVLLMQRFFWWDLIPASQKHGDQIIGTPTVSFPPDLYERGAIMVVVSLLMLLFAQKLFSRLQDKFPERI